MKLWSAACVIFAATAAASGPPAPASARATYTIDSKTSRLSVQTETVGLSSMFGHDHKFDARDFNGKLTLLPGVPESAVLELDVRGDALTLLEDVGDDTRREIAEALRVAVLDTDAYPAISFRSRSVTAKQNGDGSFDVRLAGELALHGVHRSVVIPAHVVAAPDGVRATGALQLRQSNFKIRPYTFAKGTVRVRDTIAISFDLLARR